MFTDRLDAEKYAVNSALPEYNAMLERLGLGPHPFPGQVMTLAEALDHVANNAFERGEDHERSGGIL